MAATAQKTTPAKKPAEKKVSLQDQIPEMQFRQLCLVEFRYKNKAEGWKKMLENKSPKTGGILVKCSVCQTNEIGGMIGLVQHLKGKRHERQYVNVDLAHPTIAPKTTIKAKTATTTTTNVPAKTATATATTTAVKKTVPAKPVEKATVSTAKAPLKEPKAVSNVKTVVKKPNTSNQVEPPQPKPKVKVAVKAKSEVEVEPAKKNEVPIEPAKTEVEVVAAKSDVEEIIDLNQSSEPEITNKQPETVANVNKSKEKTTEIVESKEEDASTVVDVEDNTIVIEDKSNDPNQDTEMLEPAKENAPVEVELVNDNDVQTIEVEDSPEREIVETPKAEPPKKEESFVINPLAVHASKADKPKEKRERERSPPKKVVRTEPPKKPLNFLSSTSSHSKHDATGLVGVEYVVKTVKHFGDKNPQFECALCEVDSDAVGMEWHLKGLTHRLKYLDKHFPTSLRQFESYRNDSNLRSTFSRIVEKICVAIEKYHGRDLPFECVEREYTSNRHGIMAEVFALRHASEYSGPSFTNVVDKKTLEELSNTKEPLKDVLNSKQTPIFDNPDGALARRNKHEPEQLDMEEHKKLVDQFLRNNALENRSRSRSPRSGRNRSFGRMRSRRSLSHSPSRRGRNGRSPYRENDVWDKYRRMVDDAVGDIDRDYRKYKKDPETHPAYSAEWKEFWLRRSDEIVAEGKDPSNYNFQPEWVLFWIKRMDEIYRRTVEDIKIKLRLRLGLSLLNNDISDSRYHIGTGNRDKSPPSDISAEEDRHFFNERSMKREPKKRKPSPEIIQYPIAQKRQNMDPGPPTVQPSGPMRQFGPRGPAGHIVGMHASQPQPQSRPNIEMHQPRPNIEMHQPRMNQPMIRPMHPQMNQIMYPQMNQGVRPQMCQQMPHMPMQQQIRYPMHQQMNPMQQQMNPMRQVNPMQNSHLPMSNVQPTIPQQRMVGQQHMQQGNQQVIKPLMQQDNKNNIQKKEEPPRKGNTLPTPVAVAPNAYRNPSPTPVAKPEIKPKKSPEPIRWQKQETLSERSDEKKKKQNTDEDTEIESGPLNTVSVLRLLTALEEHLGSLGPRINDLLAKALTLEKVKANSSDEVLAVPENTVLLETVREKLRGQLLADMLEKGKIRAVKQVIKDITTLLNEAAQKPKAPVLVKAEPAKPNPAPMQMSHTSSSNVVKDDEEKRELASKLATALAAQGKTDFTPEQLEQLVVVYSMIEKKQKSAANTGQNTKSLSDTLADFLKPAGQAATVPSKPSPSIQSNTPSSSKASNYDLDRHNMMQSNQSVWRNAEGSQVFNDVPQRNMGPMSVNTQNRAAPKQYSSSQNNTSYGNFKFSNLSQFDTSLKLDSNRSLPSSQNSRSSNLSLSSNSYGGNQTSSWNQGNQFNQSNQMNQYHQPHHYANQPNQFNQSTNFNQSNQSAGSNIPSLLSRTVEKPIPHNEPVFSSVNRVVKNQEPETRRSYTGYSQIWANQDQGNMQGQPPQQGQNVWNQNPQVGYRR